MILVTLFCSTSNTMIDEMVNNFEQTNLQLIQGNSKISEIVLLSTVRTPIVDHSLLQDPP